MVGLDFSQAMIDEARRRSQGTPLPVTFVQGDAHRLVFEDGLRQSDVAHRLFAQYQELGVTEVGVKPMTEIATDYAAINGVMGFDGGMRAAAEHGVVTRDEAARWLAAVEEAARAGRFFYAMTFFIAVSREPQ